MIRGTSCRLRLALAGTLAAAAVLVAPTIALAFSGGPHEHAAEQACQLFTYRLGDPDFGISRDATVPLFPALLHLTTWFKDAEPGSDETEQRTNADWIYLSARLADYNETVYDGYTSGSGGTTTYTHFWWAEQGLREHVEGGDVPYGYDNAWEKAELLWMRAVERWWDGKSGSAYNDLAYALHLVCDQGQPAHVHSDLHGPGNDDSIEEAMNATWVDVNFNWFTPLGVTGPDDWYPIKHDNQTILNDIYAANFETYNDDLADSDPRSGDPYLADIATYGGYNIQQLFQLMYEVNQTAGFFASDGEDGDTVEPIGWLGQYTWMPASYWNLTGEDSDMDWYTDVLDDNDKECPVHPDPSDETTLCSSVTCDCDGDLTKIAMTGYGAAFRAAPVVIDLFRQTIDNVPPVSTVNMYRADFETVKEWNNSPVTVAITDAVDYGRPTGLGWDRRASGIFQRWLRCENPSEGGIAPVYAADGTPSWTVDKDGMFSVQLMSTDNCGNVEGPENDFAVGVDMTPPEIAFPDLRPNYLTSQTFTCTWDAWDATSGIDHVTAYLDGEMVSKDTVIDLALLAGKHTLSVYAMDKAENWAHKSYDFEVWIDASSLALPIALNTKTSGNGLMVTVQFPAPYDVGKIDVKTCRLRVGASIDLFELNPVVGGTDTIPADLLTGVADYSHDHIRDRFIRFDKERFAQAVGSQTGDIPAVVWGGLKPDGTPRFIAAVTIPVFVAPK